VIELLELPLDRLIQLVPTGRGREAPAEPAQVVPQPLGLGTEPREEVSLLQAKATPVEELAGDRGGHERVASELVGQA
jgi:hypothetical protein